MRGITLTVTGDAWPRYVSCRDVFIQVRLDWRVFKSADDIIGKSKQSFGGVELGCASMRIEVIDVFAFLKRKLRDNRGDKLFPVSLILAGAN